MDHSTERPDYREQGLGEAVVGFPPSAGENSGYEPEAQP